MRWPLLLLSGVMIGGSAHGESESWSLIKTPDESPYKLYVDMGHVVRDGSVRLFMTKMVPAAQSDPVEASDIASVLVKVKIDCSSNTIETEAGRMVDQGGEASELQSDPTRPIKAGTDDMTLREMVCEDPPIHS